MMQLYNVCKTPLESVKYEKEYGYDDIIRIKRYLLIHEGEMALFYRLDGKKEPIPKIVQIYGICPFGVILRYRCYDPVGEFRQYLTESAGYVDIYCRAVQLKIFGDI